MGQVASLGVSRWMTRLFVWAYGVDLNEASRPLSDYRSLEDLFTRELKPGVRPIDPTPAHLVSPVDGTVAYLGTTIDQCLPLDGGQALDISSLTGTDIADERDVIVLYLSPTNYHRVHVPREGTPIRWRYLPGTLWPVFPAAVRRVHNLFARNERAIVDLETDAGLLQVVFVGAFGVGRITLTVCDLTTNAGGVASHGQLQHPNPLQRGEQLGVFHLGSTVVLLSPSGTWSWTCTAGDAVRLGEPLARLHAGS